MTDSEQSDNKERACPQWEAAGALYYENVAVAARKFFDAFPEMKDVDQFKDVYELSLPTDHSNWGFVYIPTELDQELLGYVPGIKLVEAWETFRSEFSSALEIYRSQIGLLTSQFTEASSEDDTPQDRLLSIKDECDYRLWAIEWDRTSRRVSTSNEDDWQAYSSACAELATSSDNLMIDLLRISRDEFEYVGAEVSWQRVLHIVNRQIEALAPTHEQTPFLLKEKDSADGMAIQQGQIPPTELPEDSLAISLQESHRTKRSRYRSPTDWRKVLHSNGQAASASTWRKFRKDFNGEKHPTGGWRMVQFPIDELIRAGIDVDEIPSPSA